jgi:hypothetical protein
MKICEEEKFFIISGKFLCITQVFRLKKFFSIYFFCFVAFACTYEKIFLAIVYKLIKVFISESEKLFLEENNIFKQFFS